MLEKDAVIINPHWLLLMKLVIHRSAVKNVICFFVLSLTGGIIGTDEMSFSATGLKGDFNFDGDVDGSDLAEFAENEPRY